MPEKLPVNDVVVLLPGILGSVLQRDGRDVWALSKGALFRGLITFGRSVSSLELSGDDVDNDQGGDLGDGVRATRLMPDAHIIPGFWKIDGYTKIKDRMFEQFDFTDGFNWFDFPYDWRRDNRVAAALLAEHAPKWLRDFRTASGKPDAKLVLVGHSMGGLVARHYLEVLEGWNDTRALITFGTPYRGSLNALDFMANGFKKGVGPFKLDLSNMLQSFPSVHQLLPVYPCVDDGGGTLVKIGDANGLPAGVDQAKVAAAMAFHDDIAKAVDHNGGYGRYQITPVAGIFQPTRQSAEVRNGEVTIKFDLDGKDAGGDGTVPRVSATPRELSDAAREVYATESHASLQNVDGVLVQLAGLLTWEPLAEYKGSPVDGFKLEVEEVLEPSAPIDVRVSTAAPVVNIAVLLENLDTDERFEQHGQLVDGMATVSMPPVAPGLYRVAARETDGVGVKPIHDLIVVANDSVAEQIIEMH